MEKITTGIPEDFAISLAELNKLTSTCPIERELVWDKSDDDKPREDDYTLLAKELQSEIDNTEGLLGEGDFGAGGTKYGII